MSPMRQKYDIFTDIATFDAFLVNGFPEGALSGISDLQAAGIDPGKPREVQSRTDAGWSAEYLRC